MYFSDAGEKEKVMQRVRIYVVAGALVACLLGASQIGAAEEGGSCPTPLMRRTA